MIKRLLMISMISLCLTSCKNPLGGGSGGSSLDAHYHPGYSTQFTIDKVTSLSSSSVKLEWSESKSALRYDVFYAQTSHYKSTKSFDLVLRDVSSGVVVSGLTPHVGYSFVVVAYHPSASSSSTSSGFANYTASTDMDATFSSNTAFSAPIPFTYGTDASYSPAPNTTNYLSLLNGSSSTNTTGGVQLSLMSSTATNNSSASFLATGSSTTAIQWNSSNSSLMLTPSLSSNSVLTNTAELDPSWTPNYSALVAYWTMDSYNLNFPDSINGYNATPIGSLPDAYVPVFLLGKMNGAAFFNGSMSYSPNQSATVTPVIDVPNAWTIQAWVQQSAFPSGTGSSPAFLSNNTGNAGSGENVQFCLGYCSNSMSVISASFEVNGVWYFSPTYALTNNQWTYVVGVYNGNAGTLSLYINGNLIGTTTGVPTSLVSTTASNALNELIGATPGQSNRIFSGLLDDIALWNTALTQSEIQSIYQRQSAYYSGQWVSPVSSIGSSWTSLGATTSLPFGKEMPSTSESSSYYSSITSGLLSGLIGYWKLDETTGTTVSDSSNSNVSGAIIGSATLGNVGKLGTSIGFDGSSAIIAVPSNSSSVYNSNLPSGNNPRSVSVWINPQVSASTLSSTSYDVFSYGAPYTDQAFGISVGGGHLSNFSWNDDNNCYLSICTNIQPYTWTHILVTYDGSTSSIYVNGKLAQSQTMASWNTVNTSPMMIGSNVYQSQTNLFQGLIDDVAVWNRALSSSEVLEIYRRGGNRIKYQVRSCASSTCSDQNANTSSGEGWMGPDGTNDTYFSELYNTSSNVFSGAALTTSPVMTFANFNSVFLSNNYFQYRAIFETDDMNSLCTYNSVAAACSPELQSTTLQSVAYDSSSPSISTTNTTEIMFDSLSGFVETLGTNGCSQGIHYAVSNGTYSHGALVYYYWNGTAWVVSNQTYAQANTASTLNSYLSKLGGGQYTLYIQAFLPSTGSSACELSELTVTGTGAGGI